MIFRQTVMMVLLAGSFAMTYRMWTQVDRWQWANIECHQRSDIVIP